MKTISQFGLQWILTPPNQSMCVMRANIIATKRATMCSIVKLKNTNKPSNQSMFATHVNITATKRATLCSIVKRKSIRKIQKKSLRRRAN